MWNVSWFNGKVQDLVNFGGSPAISMSMIKWSNLKRVMLCNETV